MPAIRCAGCKTVLNVKDELAGKQVRCPQCQQVLLVPKTATAAVQPPPSPPLPAPSPAPRPPAPPPTSVKPAPAPAPDDEEDPLDRPGYPRLRDLPKEPLPKGCHDEADELGEPLATMLAPNPVKWGRVGGILCLVVAVAIFIGAVSMFTAKIDDPKERANNDTGKWIVLVFGIVMTVLGVGAIVGHASMPPEAKLWMCPGGLVWLRAGKVRCCRWDEVERFYHTATHITFSSGGVGERCTFRLIAPGKEEISFESGGNSNERTFGDRLHHFVSQAALPVFAERLRQKKPLDFDLVKMDDRGLKVGKVRLDWEDIAAIELEQGVFHVRERGRGPGAAVAFGEVSQAVVFHALAQARLEQEKENRPSRRRPRE